MTNDPQEPTRYLTKSRFKIALECPRKLVYTGNKQYTDTKKNDKMLQGLAEGGFQIGALAQVIYITEAEREGVPWKEITGTQENQIFETKEALRQNSVTLLEATIQIEKFLIRADILRKRGNRIDIIEVKSKSVDSSENGGKPLSKSDYLPYLQDIAFQTMVARQAYPDFEIHSFLMMPDKAKVTASAGLHTLFPIRFITSNNEQRAQVDRPAPSTWQGLDHRFLVDINVTEEVTSIIQGKLMEPSNEVEIPFTEVARRWAIDYANQTDIKPTLSAQTCGKCEFYNPTPAEDSRSGFHECWARSAEGFSIGTRREETVLALYNDRTGLKKSQIERGRYLLREIQKKDLKWVPIDGHLNTAQRQWMQVSHEWPGGGEHYFDNANFKIEQENWRFPFLFLDFEGARSALPFRPGQRPNGINAFQYSLHTLHEDGTVEHASQFLKSEQTGNPNADFLRHLKKALGGTGTVFHWHHYERNILNELRAELMNAEDQEPDCSELISFIDTLVDKNSPRYMVDQAKIAEMFYFHPDTRGSSSIKKVLPAIMGSSPWLKRTYSQAIYGPSGPIKSLNHTRPMIWWREDPARPGKAIDPYDLLAELSLLSDKDSDRALCEAAERSQNEESTALQNGGAAMMAYNRLQSGQEDAKEELLKAAMLRYCELDTLAMVMIMQAFMHHGDLDESV